MPPAYYILQPSAQSFIIRRSFHLFLYLFSSLFFPCPLLLILLLLQFSLPPYLTFFHQHFLFRLFTLPYTPHSYFPFSPSHPYPAFNFLSILPPYYLSIYNPLSSFFLTLFPPLQLSLIFIPPSPSILTILLLAFSLKSSVFVGSLLPPPPSTPLSFAFYSFIASILWNLGLLPPCTFPKKLHLRLNAFFSSYVLLFPLLSPPAFIHPPPSTPLFYHLYFATLFFPIFLFLHPLPLLCSICWLTYIHPVQKK